MISEEKTEHRVQIDKRAFGESRDFCSIVTGEITRDLRILVSPDTSMGWG